MERISIIGAGWMGLPLADHLVNAGYRVQGTTTRSEKLPLLQKAGIKAYLLDSANAGYEDIAPLMQCDVLVVTVPPRGGEAEYGGFLQKIALSARQVGLRKLVYTSATSVYKEKNTVVTEEDAVMVESTHSGVRLLAMENIFREENSISPCILRFGGLFGPGRQPAKWLAGKKNVSGGDSPVNMVHLDDCIGVIREVIAQQAWGETFNVVTPLHPSRKEFYRRACLSANLEPPQWNNEVKPWKIVSPQKLIDKLKYSFTYGDPSLAF